MSSSSRMRVQVDGVPDPSTSIFLIGALIIFCVFVRGWNDEASNFEEYLRAAHDYEYPDANYQGEHVVRKGTKDET